MGRKIRQADLEQALAALRASGFETASYTGPEGGTLVSRNGYAAVLAAGEQGIRPVVGAGRLVGGELARIEDRGYQKFLRTSQYELPATARDLHGIHLFSEELILVADGQSLFNQSLGTTSDRYLYDRIRGRAAAVAPGHRPWEEVGGH